MGFIDKLKAEGLKASQMVKDKANNVGLEAKIFEQERKIKELSNEIGKLVVSELDGGAIFSDVVADKYQELLKIREEINELKSKKVVDEKVPVCANCGAKIGKGMSFCGSCGTKFEPKECECDNCEGNCDCDCHEEKKED